MTKQGANRIGFPGDKNFYINCFQCNAAVAESILSSLQSSLSFKIADETSIRTLESQMGLTSSPTQVSSWLLTYTLRCRSGSFISGLITGEGHGICLSRLTGPPMRQTLLHWQ